MGMPKDSSATSKVTFWPGEITSGSVATAGMTAGTTYIPSTNSSIPKALLTLAS
ncbi:hypothetical protein [Sulfuracidifex metallicus]|uniref:hypothetical protein n=1 Tax=Sulfuracidifex metallicus TaxID=47303 RepID=UPI0012EE0890|nr:hypothetical protein [Sulfuracidifex metallicus]